MSYFNCNQLNSINKNESVLIVIQQKWSNWEECKNRVDAWLKVADFLNGMGIDILLLVVWGANNGVPPDRIKEWIWTQQYEVIIDNKPWNTKEKADAIWELILRREIKNIIQCTSLYHSLRAYLTLVKSIQCIIPENDINILNVISDSENQNVIWYALCDELLLAKFFEPMLNYKIPSDRIELYDRNKSFTDIDMWFIKYLHHRVGEAKRIGRYSDNVGKWDLTTNIELENILSTFLQIDYESI